MQRGARDERPAAQSLAGPTQGVGAPLRLASARHGCRWVTTIPGALRPRYLARDGAARGAAPAGALRGHPEHRLPLCAARCAREAAGDVPISAKQAPASRWGGCSAAKHMWRLAGTPAGAQQRRGTRGERQARQQPRIQLFCRSCAGEAFRAPDCCRPRGCDPRSRQPARRANRRSSSRGAKGAGHGTKEWNRGATGAIPPRSGRLPRAHRSRARAPRAPGRKDGPGRVGAHPKLRQCQGLPALPLTRQGASAAPGRLLGDQASPRTR